MTEREQERAAVVAWLTDQASDCIPETVRAGVALTDDEADEMVKAVVIQMLANAIERGDHLTPPLDRKE